MNVIQQVRDTLDILLPVQEITIEINETQLLPDETQDLVHLVDKAVTKLLALDTFLTDGA